MKVKWAGYWEKRVGMDEGKSGIRHLGQGEHLANFARKRKISQKYSSG